MHDGLAERQELKGKNGSSGLPGRPGAGQTLNPATLVTPTVRRVGLSHDQQRTIGSERCRVSSPIRELQFGGCDDREYIT